MKKKINFFYPKKTGLEIRLLKKALDGKFFNDGIITRKFENKIKFLTNRKYAVCVTSGTTALSIALLSNNIGAGDEVIIPSFTYIATANAVTFTGAKVALVDVSINNFILDIKKILNCINKNTKAIISVEVNGRSPDYEILSKICKKKNILLITDSTEALGSFFNSKPLGSFGDASCFSFSPSKIISTGQGGAVVTNNKKIYEKIMLLKKQGIRNGTGGNDLHKNLGYNFKYTDIQASIGLAQLSHFKRRIKIFNYRNKIYLRCLKNVKNIIIPKSQDKCLNLWFDIMVIDLNKLKTLKNELNQRKIEYRSFWYPINKHTPYLSRKKYKISNYIFKHCIWLPSNFDLNERKIMAICSIIKKTLS